MKRFYLLILCVGFAVQLFSQQSDINKYSVEIKEINNPELEWSQFDNDNSECKFRKNVLELECKKDEWIACTTAELEFDASNVDFILKFQLEPEKLDDKHPFGIVYDYKNIKNFHALCFGKKQFQLLSYEGGEEAVVKEGLYKLSNKKQVLVSILKKGKRLDFYVGPQHLPLTAVRNSEIQHSNVGFYVKNKTKIKLTGFGYYLLLDENEIDKDENEIDIE